MAEQSTGEARAESEVSEPEEAAEERQQIQRRSLPEPDGIRGRYRGAGCCQFGR